jgi:hypothetical protein
MNAHLRAGWRRVIAGEDYRMDHRPPGPHYGAPLHALDDERHGQFGLDVYDHPDYYGSGQSNAEMVGAMRRARGKPDAPITIYRALPKRRTQIHTGDWVTTSAEYAHQHGMHPDDPDQDMPVIKANVPAKHLWTSGDELSEFGYHGPDVEAEIHHPGGRLAVKLSGALHDHQQQALDRLTQLPENLIQGEHAHQLFVEHNIHLHEEDPWEAGEVGDGHVTKDTGRSRFHAPDAPLHTSQDYLWRPTLEHFIRHPEDAANHEERPSTWTHEGQHWINGGHHRILADRMSRAQGTEVSDRTGHIASRSRW